MKRPVPTNVDVFIDICLCRKSVGTISMVYQSAMHVRCKAVGSQASSSVDSAKTSADLLEASPMEMVIVSQTVVWYKLGYHTTSNPTLSHLKLTLLSYALVAKEVPP